MRVSAIADWTTCEAMALTDPRPEARIHVAAWVGTMAHAILLGTTLEPRPLRQRFDATTKTAHAADVQALSIAQEASRTLDAEGWSIMERELVVSDNGDTGHLDMLAWHEDTKQTAIIDLKTGRDIGAGWLQVGGYLALKSHTADGGILHVPRVAVDREPKATLEMRDGGSLVRAWSAAKDRIDAVLAGAIPLRSPGQHCGRCASDCPVRI